MDKYVNYNAAEVLVFIYPMVERLKSKIKTLYLLDKFDFFVYQFFYDNNQDIKVEFNLYFSQLES